VNHSWAEASHSVFSLKGLPHHAVKAADELDLSVGVHRRHDLIDVALVKSARRPANQSLVGLHHQRSELYGPAAGTRRARSVSASNKQAFLKWS
jgi:hypothetical protein